jgi:hypothetical protein
VCVARLIRGRTEYPRLGTDFGLAKRWTGYTCGFVNVIDHKGASPYQSWPRKRGKLHGLQPGHTPKKIQPPVSAGYEGLLFPPEQSEKIFVAILAQILGHFK